MILYGFYMILYVFAASFDEPHEFENVSGVHDSVFVDLNFSSGSPNSRHFSNLPMVEGHTFAAPYAGNFENFLEFSCSASGSVGC